MNFRELQIALFNVANLNNERPVGLKVIFAHLSILDLLLGHVSYYSPSALCDINEEPKRKLEFRKQIISGENGNVISSQHNKTKIP